jgi:hypothetical protein
MWLVKFRFNISSEPLSLGCQHLEHLSIIHPLVYQYYQCTGRAWSSSGAGRRKRGGPKFDNMSGKLIQSSHMSEERIKKERKEKGKGSKEMGNKGKENLKEECMFYCL